MLRKFSLATLLVGFLCGLAQAEPAGIVFEGTEGPGKDKHVVLIAGDEEYRSEEALPQLAKILATHHGFKCTVLFALNKDGEIDPNATTNIPGTEVLKTADLMILALRFRALPPQQMQPIEDYINSGKPIMGLRTATHAFNMGAKDPFAKWSNGSGVKGFEGGFGKQVLGEKWVAHHGAHGRESTRGVIAPGEEKNPIVRGCEDIWGPTDVYTVTLPLPGDSKPLVLGQVLTGMKPDDKPLEGKKNNPMMPIAWTKTWTPSEGKTARVFTTTMGSSTDLASEGFRRLLVNAAYWCVGLEDKIPERAKVDVVGEYNPTPFGFGKGKKGVKPADLK